MLPWRDRELASSLLGLIERRSRLRTHADSAHTSARHEDFSSSLDDLTVLRNRREFLAVDLNFSCWPHLRNDCSLATDQLPVGSPTRPSSLEERLTVQLINQRRSSDFRLVALFRLVSELSTSKLIVAVVAGKR